MSKPKQANKLRLAEDCYCLVDREGMVVELCHKHLSQQKLHSQYGQLEFLAKQSPDETSKAY